ncbi:unnamed protein product [Nesidiocoris tenuis]|uniref:Uncharacterized protein n=1 Tax=Nesidiocoris tenuis TaxID=355587 RepID=A0A6H5H0W3_9HEMI|nr:unnamed protein product [Nesidiocoris tenuis]
MGQIEFEGLLRLRPEDLKAEEKDDVYEQLCELQESPEVLEKDDLLALYAIIKEIMLYKGQQLLQDVSDLQKEKNDLRREIILIQNEAQSATLQTSLDEEPQENVAVLKDHIQSKNKHILQLLSDIEVLSKKKLTSLEEQNAGLSSQISELVTEKNKKDARLDQLIDDLEERILKWQEVFILKDNEVAELKARLAEVSHSPESRPSSQFATNYTILAKFVVDEKTKTSSGEPDAPRRTVDSPCGIPDVVDTRPGTVHTVDSADGKQPPLPEKRSRPSTSKTSKRSKSRGSAKTSSSVSSSPSKSKPSSPVKQVRENGSAGGSQSNSESRSADVAIKEMKSCAVQASCELVSTSSQTDVASSNLLDIKPMAKPVLSRQASVASDDPVDKDTSKQPRIETSAIAGGNTQQSEQPNGESRLEEFHSLLQKKCDELRSEFSDIKSNTEHALTEMYSTKDTIKNLQAILNQKEELISRYQELIKENGDEYNKLREQYRELEASSTSNRVAVADTQAVGVLMEKWLTRVHHLEEDIRDMTSQLAESSAGLEQAKMEADHWKKEALRSIKGSTKSVKREMLMADRIKELEEELEQLKERERSHLQLRRDKPNDYTHQVECFMCFTCHFRTKCIIGLKGFYCNNYGISFMLKSEVFDPVLFQGLFIRWPPTVFLVC